MTASRIVMNLFLFSFPIFFLPFTLDLLEVNKQSLLLFIVCVSCLLWISSGLLKRSFSFRPNWIFLFPFLLTLSFGISAWFSPSQFLSWIGYMNQEYVSVLTVFCLSILFLFLVNTFSSNNHPNVLRIILLSSAVLTGGFGIFQIIFPDTLPFFANSQALFNSVGTANSLAIYLLVMCIYGSAVFLIKQNHGQKKRSLMNFILILLVILIHFETLFFLLVLDYGKMWLLSFIGFGSLFVFIIYHANSIKSISRIFLPSLMVAVSIPFWFFLSNPLPFQVPIEVGTNFASSYSITKDTFLNTSPLIGSGPGTFIMDYDAYHLSGVNTTDFWNTRFDKANSFLMTLAPTVGYVGVVFFLMFLISIVVLVAPVLIKRKEEENWSNFISVLCPWITLVVASFLFPFNITLFILLFVFSALLVSLCEIKERKFALKESKGTTLILTSSFFIFILVLFLGIFFTAGRYMADVSYTKAIRLDRKNADIQNIVSFLDRAATLNRFRDDYYRNLSQSLLLRIGEEIKQVDPNVKLTEESQKYIQSLVAASVNSAVRATTLSPNYAVNWENRGFVYRELALAVPNASKFAIESYLKAITLEPLNPEVWTELGKTYLVAAEEERTLSVAKDFAISKQAKIDFNELLNKAEDSFIKAIELKFNYAPAHYQLSITYDREGKLNEATQKMESVFQYNMNDIGVGFQLGMLYLRRNSTGDLEKARIILEHVVDIAPSYSNARWYLSSIYEKQGKKDKAIEQITKVMELNPGNSIVKSRFETLKSGSIETTTPPPLNEKK